MVEMAEDSEFEFSCLALFAVSTFARMADDYSECHWFTGSA